MSEEAVPTVAAEVAGPGLVRLEADMPGWSSRQADGWLSGGEVRWSYDEGSGELAVVLHPAAGVLPDGRTVGARVTCADGRVAREICFDHRVEVWSAGTRLAVVPGLPFGGWPGRQLIQLSCVPWERDGGVVRLWAQLGGFGFGGSDTAGVSEEEMAESSWRLCRALNEEVGTRRSVQLVEGTLIGEVDAAMGSLATPSRLLPERFRVEVFVSASAAGEVGRAGAGVEVRLEVPDPLCPGERVVLPLPLGGTGDMGAPRP